MVGWVRAAGEVYQQEDGEDSLRWHTRHNPGRSFSHPQPCSSTSNGLLVARGSCWPQGDQCPMRSALNGRVEYVEVEEYIVHLVDSPAGWPWRHWKREQNLDSFHWMGQTNIISGMMELGGSSTSSGA